MMMMNDNALTLKSFEMSFYMMAAEEMVAEMMKDDGSIDG